MSAHSYARYTLQTLTTIEEPYPDQPARSYTIEKRLY